MNHTYTKRLPPRLFLTLGICLSVWVPPSQSAASYPMTMPWRGDALDPGVYFRSRGHTGADYGNSGDEGAWGIDFHAAMWNGTKWVEKTTGSDNEDAFIYGVPLYSPVDGEIIACWRTAPDKPGPGQNYDLDNDGIFGEADNCSISGDPCTKDADCPNFNTCVRGHDASPLGGGNHVQIRDSSGDFIILYAHMQYDSIPPELCPLPANRDDADTTSSPGLLLPGADGWPDDDTDDCDLSGQQGFQRDTILATPVPIKAGDFVGRVGHSGRSTNPHLHLHAKPLNTDGQGDFCLDETQELEFYEAWSQTCASGVAPIGDWAPLDGDNPLEAWDLMGTTCDEDLDCDPGETCDIPTGKMTGECVITKPAHCFLPDAIGIEEDHEDFGVPASNLHFTTYTTGDVLVYQSSGDLRVRSYNVSGSGTITAQDVENEGAVLDVAAARPLSNQRHVIVSIRGSNGNLKHIPYSVNSANGAITRMVGQEVSEGDIGQVESTPSPAHSGFVVAIENSLGNLEVVDYNVDSSLVITEDPAGIGTGGAINEVAITTMSYFDGVVTAEITGGGGLRLRSFDVPASGGVSNADDYVTFVAGESVTIDRVPTADYLGVEYVVTSVILPNDKLRLDSWEIDASGTIDWVESFIGDEVGASDGAAGSTITGDFVMALRDPVGEFQMIGWDVDSLGQLRQNSALDLDAVNQVGLVASSAGGGHRLVAARTDAMGELHLYTYVENYDGWF